MDRTGLDEFREFVNDFKSLSALGAKGAIAIPLADLFAQVGPPWPPLLAPMTSVAQLLVLMLIFQLWYGLTVAQITRRIKLGAVAFVILFFLYLALAIWLVIDDLPGGSRTVEGFIVRPDVQEVLGPGFSARQALEAAEYDPQEVWTRGSITAANLLLVGSWLALFSSFTVTAGAFVLHQRKRRVPF
jgi:hypothetical protein